MLSVGGAPPGLSSEEEVEVAEVEEEGEGEEEGREESGVARG